MTNKDHKLSYKLYKPDGTYIKNLEEDGILSSFQVSKNINGGVGNLKVTINKPIDDYDEYDSVKNPDGSIKYGNRLKVILNDDNNTDKQIFYGYLVTIGPNYKNGKESVELVFFGAVSKLTNDYYRDYTTPVGDPIDFYVKYVSGAVSPEKAPANASEIIEDVIDNYIDIDHITYPMITKSIDNCGGTDLEYTFDRVKQYDAIKKMQEFLPVTWYWYVNGDGVINVKDSASSTQHKLVIGKDISAIKSHKTSEDIINYFVLWNARSTADLSYVYVTEEDATSRTNYGTHTLFQNDSAILSDAIADIRKDKVIEYNKNPTEEITIEVTDEYDIASIEPGDRVSIRNIRVDAQTTFADDLVVVKVSYTIDSALIELGALGSNLTKFSNEESNAFEVALKQVYGIQSGGVPITEANIEFGGESFIKKDIIYSPTLAGINGYFKESIRMGDSGVGSVIRTYGKTGFGDLSSGIWIEKNSSEDIYFELYKDSDNFLRFNTNTGKLEISGDITMSAGSTITWANISDASVPNSADLSDFNNDDSWTDDANLDLLRNGGLAGGTFITGTSIASPVITGGIVRTNISPNKRVVMADDKIEIYNASNVLVGKFEGIAGAGGSVLEATIATIDYIGMNAIGGGFTSITKDGAIGIDVDGMVLSTNKLGGGIIKFIPETGEDVYSTEDINLASGKEYKVNGVAIGGEVNTASNKGGTYGWYNNKSGVDLQFRGFSIGSGLSVTDNTTYWTLNHAVGSGHNHIPTGGTTYYTLYNTGAGVAGWSRAVYIGNSAYYFDYAAGGIISSKSLLPLSDNTFDLGDSVKGWRRVYIGQNGAYLYDLSGKIFSSATLGVNKINIAYYANNPSQPGDITNYSSLGTEQFRGRPGGGSWTGSFDMTAY